VIYAVVPANTIPLKKKSVLSLKAYEVKTVLLICAVVKALTPNVYYRWSKDFLEAGKKRLSGDTALEANTDEVKTLRSESAALKEALAEAIMENRLLKKSVIADGEDGI